MTMTPILKRSIQPTQTCSRKHCQYISYLKVHEENLCLLNQDEENVYKIKTCLYLLPHALNHPEDGRLEYIHFTRPHGNNTELPSHVLLQTHAAIAQIYHAGGMVRQHDPLSIIIIKQIRRIYKDMIEFSTTDRAFNSSFWECYTCYRNFRQRDALNSCLSSPVHNQSVYRRPNARASYGKQFSTLLALFSHLENEAYSFSYEIRKSPTTSCMNSMIV